MQWPSAILSDTSSQVERYVHLYSSGGGGVCLLDMLGHIFTGGRVCVGTSLSEESVWYPVQREKSTSKALGPGTQFPVT